MPELSQPQWVCDLAFMTDLCCHFDSLNIALQGKNANIVSLSESVNTFIGNLTKWDNQLSVGDMCNFPCIQSLGIRNPLDGYRKILQELSATFESKFSDLKNMGNEISLFTNPFNFRSLSSSFGLQDELEHLETIVTDRNTKNVNFDFYRQLSSESFPKIRCFAAHLMAIFGTTYLCEQTFSKMSLIKCNVRSTLTDKHLGALLRLCTTSLSPNIEALVRSKRLYLSSQRSK